MSSSLCTFANFSHPTLQHASSHPSPRRTTPPKRRAIISAPWATLVQVRECNERTDELTWPPYLISTYCANFSVRSVAAANFYAVSYVMNISSFATRFARRSLQRVPPWLRERPPRKLLSVPRRILPCTSGVLGLTFRSGRSLSELNLHVLLQEI